jgi:hypothetical protein
MIKHFFGRWSMAWIFEQCQLDKVFGQQAYVLPLGAVHVWLLVLNGRMSLLFSVSKKWRFSAQHDVGYDT